MEPQKKKQGRGTRRYVDRKQRGAKKRRQRTIREKDNIIQEPQTRGEEKTKIKKKT